MGMDRSTFCIFIFVILFPVLIRADFFTILPFVETCEIAKQDYWTRNPDVFNAILDPVWHYQNAPPSEGRTWTFGLCDLETSVYPNDTICNCNASITWFLNRYVWLSQTPSTAFDYWVNHQSQTDGGLVWHCDFCHNDSAPTDSPTDSPTDPTPSPEPNNTAAPTPTPTPPSTPSHELPYNCTCVVAGVDYLARYIDVAHSNLDPVYHYQRSGWAEGRFWDCSLCNADSVYREDPICNCTAAAKNYTDSYPWQTGADLGNAFSLWQENWVTKGEIWHCEFCLPTDEHRSIREYSVGLSAGLGAIVGLGVIVSIFAAVMLWLHWDAFQKHGSFYCALILTGVGLSYVSALVLLPRPTDELCLAFPWFLGVAFILVYGCLFVKTWVLYRVWRKAIQYKRTTITPTYIIKGIGIALAFEIAFLIIWTILDPPKVHLEKMVDGTYEYQCKSKNIAFWSVFLCVKGVWLVFGAAMSILTRSVVKEYNESSSIAYAIYNDIGLAIIAVPLAIILGNVPGGVLVIEVAVIVLAFTFTMCILFFDIWYSVLFHEKDILGEKLRNMVQPSRTSTTTTTATISTAATLSHTASSQQV